MAQQASMTNVIPLRREGATTVAEKLSTGDELGLHDKLTVYQTLNRVWRRHLSSDEVSTILYIVDRTVGWGRSAFTAAASNVLEGTEDFAGIGIPRRSYYRVLDALEMKGLISRKSARDRTQITLNVAWNPEKIEMLPVPKRMKKAQECHGGTSRSAKTDMQECHGGTQNTVDRNTVNYTARVEDLADQWDTPKQETPSPEKEKTKFFGAAKETRSRNTPQVQPGATDVFPALRDQLEAAQTSARQRVAEKASAVLTKKGTRASEIEAVWRTAIAESHPLHLHVAWAKKDLGMVATALKKWEHAASGTFAQFVDYAVRNWTTICARKFAWMSKSPAPKYPTLSFLIARLADFVEAWATDAAVRFATDAENDAYQRLRVAGKSHDEAIREMARREAMAATREEMAKRERVVMQNLKRAKDHEQRASQFEALGSGRVTAKDGQEIEIIPGTPRRPGQVWGHQPVIRRVPTTPPPEPLKHPAAAVLDAPPGLPSWNDILVRRAAQNNRTQK